MIRLILLILLFLLSLLAVFKAPTYHLWLIAILVTEFPMIFAGLAALVTALGYWLPRFQVPSLILGTIAFLLFISPIIRAYLVGGELNKHLNAAFNTSANNEPIKFSSFFRLSKNNVEKAELTYLESNATTLKLDYYRAVGNEIQPCVVVVHGGSWSSGDSKQLPELNSRLARKGYNVASINYRLAPLYQSPAPADDVETAINYLKANSEKLGIDTNNFVLLGRSAGAQIALLAAYTRDIAGLKGVIDFYGPADMIWGYSIPSNPLIMDSRKVMGDYLGGTYQEVPDNFFNSSPLEFVSPQSPPTLIIHGYNDVLVAYEHSRRLNEKLQKYKVPHYFLKLPWATHGFDFNLNGPGGQLSTHAVEKFLKAVTR